MGKEGKKVHTVNPAACSASINGAARRLYEASDGLAEDGQSSFFLVAANALDTDRAEVAGRVFVRNETELAAILAWVDDQLAPEEEPGPARLELWSDRMPTFVVGLLSGLLLVAVVQLILASIR